MLRVTRMVDAPEEFQQAERPYGLAHPPHVGIRYAVGRYWLLIVAVIAAFTAAGVYAARTRASVYTAESRLAVGRVDTTPGSLSTFAVAAQALAAQYARTVGAEGVVTRAARRLDIPPVEVAGRISATPIPQSPVVKVSAVGRSADAASRLANAAAAGLIGYTTALNRSNPDTPRLLAQYRQASARVYDLRRQLGDARKRNAAASTRRTRRRVDALRVDLSVAQLRLDSIRAAYNSTMSSQASTSLLQVLAPARGATSDRSRYVQTLGFIGFAVGAAVGLALAMLLASARVRRRALR
jgi:uncharacterized protein involved in exopolysaccharide biosynthesis